MLSSISFLRPPFVVVFPLLCVLVSGAGVHPLLDIVGEEERVVPLRRPGVLRVVRVDAAEGFHISESKVTIMVSIAATTIAHPVANAFGCGIWAVYFSSSCSST